MAGTKGKVEETAENVGVINPYALAEVVLGRKVRWRQVGDPKKLLEESLGFAYEELFDPKHGSPLYAGLRFDPARNTMEKADLKSTAEGPVKALIDVGTTVVWVDPGDFFEQGAEMLDPVQGALGDCYFIAALSSVAWARTYVIAQRARATDAAGAFVDMIEFFGSAGWAKVEVTEQIPLRSPGNSYIYCRSSDPGEIWPAVYEKAYAKWRTNDTDDRPNYAPIAGGDPVGAARQLTGLTAYYFWCKAMTPSAIYQKVRENSISMKTFNPMVAWTYPSGDASPDKVNYTNATLVANHAYSIVGWQYLNGQGYVVLRNPWGTHEATMNVAGGTWVSWDAPYYGGPGFWRPISFATNDGVFALRVDTFKSYFAGLGVVK
jgi:hypothetical protein